MELAPPIATLRLQSAQANRGWLTLSLSLFEPEFFDSKGA